MDPGYRIRHHATRRGLRVVLELTATGGATALARTVDEAVREVRELLRPAPPGGGLRPSRGPRPDDG